MKKQLRELLLRPDFEQLVDLAGRRRRALSSLVSLTYDSDPLLGWHGKSSDRSPITGHVIATTGAFARI